MLLSAFAHPHPLGISEPSLRLGASAPAPAAKSCFAAALVPTASQDSLKARHLHAPSSRRSRELLRADTICWKLEWKLRLDTCVPVGSKQRAAVKNTCQYCNSAQERSLEHVACKQSAAHEGPQV